MPMMMSKPSHSRASTQHRCRTTGAARPVCTAAHQLQRRMQPRWDSPDHAEGAITTVGKRFQRLINEHPDAVPLREEKMKAASHAGNTRSRKVRRRKRALAAAACSCKYKCNFYTDRMWQGRRARPARWIQCSLSENIPCYSSILTYEAPHKRKTAIHYARREPCVQWRLTYATGDSVSDTCDTTCDMPCATMRVTLTTRGTVRPARAGCEPHAPSSERPPPAGPAP